LTKTLSLVLVSTCTSCCWTRRSSLAAGLYGIEQQLELTPPIEGNAYEANARPLPKTLETATALLKQSQAARALLGDAFLDHYVNTREWEARQHQLAVTDWELERYFEII